MAEYPMGVFFRIVFYRKLKDNLLNIPKETKVTNSFRKLPYVFIGDDAFPLRSDILKPFRQNDLNCNEKKKL